MGIDFSAAVLAPNMEVFAISVSIDPVKSQPGAQPYPARGIVTSRSMDVALENGEVVSSNQTTLGIRGIEYSVLPMRGDGCTINDGPQAGTYWIADITPDRQGKYDLLLRQK